MLKPGGLRSLFQEMVLTSQALERSTGTVSPTLVSLNSGKASAECPGRDEARGQRSASENRCPRVRGPKRGAFRPIADKESALPTKRLRSYT